MIGISPNVVVTFVSEAYPGSVSDRDLVLHSKILDQLNVGDGIMWDKGFLLHDVIPDGKVS
jgi:hypothetical protein